MPTIAIATSDDEIARCLPVMAQLRPYLDAGDAEAFVARVRRMQGTGFLLAYRADDAGVVRAVAGYRYLEQLVRGRTLYVDDLVTDADARSTGHGAALLEWLYGEACAARCNALTLDSGVQRHQAHRFYFREGMHVVGFHFVRDCPGFPEAGWQD